MTKFAIDTLVRLRGNYRVWDEKRRAWSREKYTYVRVGRVVEENAEGTRLRINWEYNDLPETPDGPAIRVQMLRNLRTWVQVKRLSAV